MPGGGDRQQVRYAAAANEGGVVGIAHAMSQAGKDTTQFAGTHGIAWALAVDGVVASFAKVTTRAHDCLPSALQWVFNTFL
jgi:alcohol dehydrogenase class IV